MRFLVHAVASSHEGITLTEVSSKGERIIYANEGFASLTGYDRSEIRGRDWSFLQGPNTDPDVSGKLNDAIVEGRTATVEILNYRKNGAPFWNRVSVTPVPEVGAQGRYFVAVHSDVTVAKRNEDRLRAAHNKLRQANVRMRQNLAAAAQVQQALLPQDLPDYPWGSVAWRFRPCDELAGDNLSVFELDDAHLAFYVLDVCGHGVAAALLSVTVRRFLSPTVASSSMMVRRGTVWSSRIVPPAKVADQLNERFSWDADHGQFFTLFYGVLNVKTGQLRYALAGHPRPVLVSGGRVRELGGQGFPIGLCPGSYEEEEITLGPGDRIIAYSDGLTEVMNAQHRSFGEERLFNALHDTAMMPLEDALDGVLENANAWRGNARLRDDITIAAIEMNRTQESRWSW
jgi:PAS domain S-box-containing protein